MQTVFTASAPRPAGHYSQAVVLSGVVYVSGQLPFDANTSIMPEGIEAQTVQALKNVEAILVAAGSSLAKLVSVQLFIADVALWPKVNRAYTEVMGEHKPARTIVPVGNLHYGALIEINAIAAVQ
jgi:2-iminobutanoate/2-iminopropanoate deaminase